MPGIDERDIVLPVLRTREERLLGAVEDAGGDLEKADPAERRMIEELRRLGNEALTAWARNGIARCAGEARDQAEGRSGGKKNSTGIRPSAKLR